MSHDFPARNIRKGRRMTQGFQQQDTGFGFAFPKSAATPQHVQKPPKTPLRVREPRIVKPRPGH